MVFWQIVSASISIVVVVASLFRHEEIFLRIHLYDKKMCLSK